MVVNKKIQKRPVEKSGKRRFTFIFEAPAGKHVCVAGAFNDWDPEQKVLEYKSSKGVYSGVIMLEPGTYEYKFVIDGEWVLDPKNPNFSHNDFGTLNSKLIVE